MLGTTVLRSPVQIRTLTRPSETTLIDGHQLALREKSQKTAMLHGLKLGELPLGLETKNNK